jgi:Domain of unknown function (DUF5753)
LTVPDLSWWLQHFTRSAFRLEALPEYQVPQEAEMLSAFKRGKPIRMRDDHPWLLTVKQHCGAAKSTDGALRWADQAQRDRLQSVATLPNVTISMTSAPFPFLHPFVIWHLEDERLVTVETYSAELQVRDDADLARYQEVWQRLSQTARPWSG